MEPDVNPASKPSEMVYEPAPLFRAEHRENSVTRVLEQQAAKVPSDWFLLLSLASMAVSLSLEIAGQRRSSRFVGMWVGPLLTMGVYNKLVKILGGR